MADHSIRSELRRRDPDRIVLRRASRIAVAVPLTLALMAVIPGLWDSSVYASFGVLSLLLFSDFGGSLRSRALAYLIATAMGIPLIVLGASVAGRIWPAMAVMFAVTLVIGLLGVLRGAFGSAQRTLLLITVVALTDPITGRLGYDVAAWMVGGVVATIAAVVLWPAQPRKALRHGIDRVYSAAGVAVRQRWGSDPVPKEQQRANTEALFAEFLQLRERYDGNLLRPSGATSSDRALAELVEDAARLISYQRWINVAPQDRAQELTAADCALADTTAAALATIGPAVLRAEAHLQPQQVAAARIAHLDQVAAWLPTATGDPETIRQSIDDSFPVRMTSITAQLSLDQAYRFAGMPSGEETSMPYPRRTVWQRLRPHLSTGSPWFLISLRSAVALSIAVGLANYLGLGHAFWIVLGTLSALRFDAMGTGRTAVQGLLGTGLGVVVGALLIWAVGDRPLIWAVLIPIAVFVAGYTKDAFSFVVGQAGFSVVTIVLFSFLVEPTYETAALRILEVSIGLMISLVVGVALWPRGVVATLHGRMIDAMDACLDYLVAAVDSMVGGYVNDQQLQRIRTEAFNAMAIASETYDLSVAQGPPDTVALSQWARAANAIRHIYFAATVMPRVTQIVHSRGGPTTLTGPVVGPLLETVNDVRSAGQDAVRVFCGGAGAPWRPLPEPAAVHQLRLVVDHELANPGPWVGVGPDPRPAMLAWLADWTALLAWYLQWMASEFAEPDYAASDAA